ncbi:MAG: GNAT family N-acetyltransferase, partial [Ktedonobacterales bacterium]
PDAGGVGLTRVVRPALHHAALDVAMLDWATTRARTLARERGASMTLDVEQEEYSSEWAGLLARHGFAPASQGDVYMACPLDGDLPDAALPDGYIVRPLAGERELDAYTALFGFAPMRAEHRLALLHRPDYIHLVAVAPDGALAAYCECSYTRAEWERGAPRIAWVDYIGTSEAHRRRGLGRAVLLASQRQMRAWGAETAMLTTMASNTTAQSVYTAAGFRITAAVRSSLKTISPA